MLEHVIYENGTLSDYINPITGRVVFIGLRNRAGSIPSFYIYESCVGYDHIIRYNKSYPYKEINHAFIKKFKTLGVEIC